MKRFTALLPLALAISLPASGQTLQEAMRSALEYHPEVQSALNARLSVDESLKAAKGGYLPKVDLLMGYGWEGSDNPTTRGDGDHRKTLTRGESNLSLQQMLFDGFATDSEVARQRATVNSRALELMGISQRTALKTAEVYLDVLRRQEFVRLAEYNLRSHERVYEQITQRSARGVGRMADQEQAEARLAQARNNLITEQTNLADAKVNYFSVVGRPAENLSPPDGLAGLVPEDLLAARQEMLQNNPFLRSSEADVDAADAQYQAARSTYYPRFDMELANGYNDDLDGTKGHDNSWQAMVRMRYNLFHGGSDKADIQSKAHQIDEARDIRNNTLRVLNEEIGLAWNAMRNAQQQYPISEQYAERARRVRDAYQQQFTIGERTLLDLLDSENELFTSSRRREDIRFTSMYSQYRVKAVMGSLIQSQNVVAPMAAAPMDDVRARVALPDID